MRPDVYRGPAEPPARATASGTQNIIPAPSTFKGLGALGIPAPCPSCHGPIVSFPPARYPVSFKPAPGSTNTVPQPPPTTRGTYLAPNSGALPLSPQPSPTVGVPSSQTAPQNLSPGALLDASGNTPSSISGIGVWLGESTLINGIPNWGIAAAGALLLWMSMGGKRR